MFQTEPTIMSMFLYNPITGYCRYCFLLTFNECLCSYIILLICAVGNVSAVLECNFLPNSSH